MFGLAFSIASSIPSVPHARDRSRIQESVVDAYIEVGLLVDAAHCAQQIDGWRRGESLAHIGQRYLDLGDREKAREFATRALDVARAEDEWRRERVTMEAARIYMLLGDHARVEQLTKDGSQAELAAIATDRTTLLPSDQLDLQADTFDRAIATKNFDIARSAIDGYVVWLGRVVDDETRRERALVALDQALPGLPADLQVTNRLRIAEVLSTSDRPDLAGAQIARADEIVAQTKFLPEDVASVNAKVALAHAGMGETDSARATLHLLLSQHAQRRIEIVDLRRAASLRSLAEAFAEIGDTAAMLDCYALALDEGALNPNARPRAEDLCATCVSIGRVGITPPPALLERIRSIQSSLTDPW